MPQQCVFVQCALEMYLLRESIAGAAPRHVHTPPQSPSFCVPVSSGQPHARSAPPSCAIDQRGAS